MVYSFRIKAAAQSEMTVARNKRTAESIEKLGGEIIAGTGEDVDPTKLDGQGRYVTKGSPTG